MPWYNDVTRPGEQPSPDTIPFTDAEKQLIEAPIRAAAEQVYGKQFPAGMVYGDERNPWRIFKHEPGPFRAHYGFPGEPTFIAYKLTWQSGSFGGPLARLVAQLHAYNDSAFDERSYAQRLAAHGWIEPYRFRLELPATHPAASSELLDRVGPFTFEQALDALHGQLEAHGANTLDADAREQLIQTIVRPGTYNAGALCPDGVRVILESDMSAARPVA